MPLTQIDRRQALKEQRSAAILRAAQKLIAERGGLRFSVDELAERAGVARRTVFNHFRSLDGVILTLCEGELEEVVDILVSEVDHMKECEHSRAALFDQIAHAIDKARMPEAIAKISALIGPSTTTFGDEKAHHLTRAAYERLSERVLDELTQIYPEIERLDVELLVSSLINGMVVIATHWAEQTGTRLTPESKALWNDLVAKLVDSVRNGYLPTP